MTNYTPGPWFCDSGKIKAIDHGRFFTIASAESRKLTDEGNEANARLIAAAPELLEALKNALLNEGQDACCLPYVNPCHCWRCQARRSIAKATGAAENRKEENEFPTYYDAQGNEHQEY